MSRILTKPTKWHVHPATTQISLGICPVWSVFALWVAKDPSFLQVDSKDSDQTGQMPRLIWVFARRTCHFVGFVTMWLIFLASALASCSEVNSCSHIMRKPIFGDVWQDSKPHPSYPSPPPTSSLLRYRKYQESWSFGHSVRISIFYKLGSE